MPHLAKTKQMPDEFGDLRTSPLCRNNRCAGTWRAKSESVFAGRAQNSPKVRAVEETVSVNCVQRIRKEK
jgi:hypothetical protein